jgi:hypothetical protein
MASPESAARPVEEEGEYNPLDYRNLTVNLIRELMARGPYPLPPATRVAGAGVYALFYTGDLPIYDRYQSPDASRPIYVGKAIPRGGRTGQHSGAAAIGTPLYTRLTQHSRSIDAATNLRLVDFQCRFLVVTPLWITMAERFLFEEFQPLWNVKLSGFGIHGPGSGRNEQEISWWDALHPGRAFAVRLRQTRSEKDAETLVVDWRRLQLEEPEAARNVATQAALDEADK